MPSSFAGLGHDIALDSASNVVYSGKFLGTIDFDPGPGVYELSAPSSSEDGFVSKVTPDGEFLWAHKIGSTYDDRVTVVATDPLGPIYAAGLFKEEVDFDPTNGEYILDGGWWNAGFLVKYQYDGTFEWAVKMGYEVKGVDTDADGNVYITGTFSDTVDLDPGAGVMEFASHGEKDIFIAKLNPNGALLWAKHIGGAGGDDLAQALAIDNQGNLYASGVITTGVDMDPGSDTLLLGTSNAQSIFVIKLDEDGNLVQPWPLLIRGYEDATYVNRIAIDADNNLFLTGTFFTTSDFDPSPALQLLHSNGMHDVFIAKYSSAMNCLWATSFGGSEEDFPQGINVDHYGNVYCSGYIADTVTVEGITNSVQLNAVGGTDAFYTKFNPDGELDWAHSFGDYKTDGAGGIVVNQNNDIYITGYFFGTVDFDPSSSVYEVQHNEFWDLYLLKLSYCATRGELTVNGPSPFCAGDSVELTVNVTGDIYEWSVGDTTPSIFASTEGPFWVSVVDTSEGCNAVSDTISLEISTPSIDIVSFPNDNLLQVSAAASSYQWFLNGDTIPGATGLSYTPSVSGNYQVAIVGFSGCEAISPPFEYTFEVGIEEHTKDNLVIVSPNPNSGSFTITSSALQQVMITDATGKLVRQLTGDTSSHIHVEGLSAGLYLVQVQMANGSVENAKVVVN